MPEHVEDILLIGVHDLDHDIYWGLVQFSSHSFYVTCLETLFEGQSFMQVNYTLVVLELLKLVSGMDELDVS